MSESEVFTKLPQWEQTQYKSFRNWVNINLSSLKHSVAQLESDFKNGTRLAELIEILQQKTIGKWNKEPKRQMQEIENLNMAITAIQKDKVKIVNIGATDINGGNLKIILGLIWTLIQHYHINQLSFIDDLDLDSSSNLSRSSSGNVTASTEKKPKVTAKDLLLKKVNEICAPWKYEAKNFTTDFADGRILQCLAYTRNASLRDPVNLGQDKLVNCNEALESLDKLNVPRVMDAIDIAGNHDEKAMMTLLGYVLKEVNNRPQVVNGPGQIAQTNTNQNQTSNNNNMNDEEELLEENTQVHSSKNDTPSNQNQSDAPRVKVDRKALFNRFVEIGRVVLINYGEYEGRIAAILDVIDANSVIVSGPTSGVPRTPISIKRIQLTDITCPIKRNPRNKTLEKIWNENKIQQAWENTSWGRKLQNRKRKSEMNDFDRFKAVVAHKERAKLIRAQRKQIQPSKKSKK